MRRPNLFIVGAPKCGTTSMFDYFSGHPDIFLPASKEPTYAGFAPNLHFGPRYRAVQTEQNYLERYALATTQKWVIDATPIYLIDESSAGRIHDFSPDARIIIMLRNPVAMMYSLHGQNLYDFHEDLCDFEEALSAESDRRAGRRIPRLIGLLERIFYRRWVAYATHVKQHFDVFGRERVHVILFDDFVSDTRTVFKQALHFLEVDESIHPKFEISNAAGERQKIRAFLIKHTYLRPLAASIPAPMRRVGKLLMNPFVPPPPQQRPLSDEARNRLQREFASEVDRLEALIQRDLSRWRAK